MRIIATTLLLLCLAPDLTADNFGYCIEGTDLQSVEDMRWANRSTPTSSGPLDSISVYLQLTQTPKKVHCAVYKWSDTSFVDSTEVITVGAGTSWITFDFIGNDSIFADTEYALVVQAESKNGVCYGYYHANGGTVAYDVLSTYEAWPTPKWTTVFATGPNHFSLCCYYTVEGEAAGQVIIIQQ